MSNSRAFAVCVVLSAVLAGQPAAAQKSKDTLRYPVSDLSSGIDTYLLPGAFANMWSPSVYDHLLGYDPGKGQFVGQLAKAWSQPNDTTYDLELRADVKFHDGQPLTADDVVYTIKYLIDPQVKLRFKSYWAWIASVEKLGPSKVRIVAKQPVADGMAWMASRTPMYPQHAHGPAANKLDFASHPVGTGPLRIVKFDENSGIVAERYDGYVASAMKSGSSVGRIVSEPINDPGTIVAALLTGKADVALDLPPDQAKALEESGRFEVTLSPPGIAITFLSLPSKGTEKVEALADARVRTAIIKAIDRQALLKLRYGSLAASVQPLEGLCEKAQRGCGYTRPVPAYDPAGAKKLLAEAGYADGFDVAINCYLATLNEATAAAGMLRAVGIRATVQTHTIAQRVQLTKQGRVAIGYYGWSGGSMFDVSGQLGRHVSSDDYDDPVIAKLAAETYSMMDDAARRKAAAAIFDRITEQAYAFPMLPNQSVFTHTREVTYSAHAMRADLPNPHEFGWK